MATHAANGGDAVADTVVDTAVVDVDVLTTPTAVVSALDGTMPVVGSRMDLVADSGLPTADTAQLAALRIAKLQRFFGESEIPWEADPALVVRGNGVGTSTHTPDAASCRNDGLDGGRQTDVDSARRVWLSSGLSAASMAGEAGTTRSLASLASVAAATAAASTAAPPTAWGSTASEQTALRAVPSAISMVAPSSAPAATLPAFAPLLHSPSAAVVPRTASATPHPADAAADGDHPPSLAAAAPATTVQG